MIERTILVVDDDADIREIVQLSLEMQPGWRVVGAVDGERAVEEAVASRADLILLDVNLTGMDGPATLRALRADARTANIPVLFLTGTTRDAEVARLRSLGAMGVLGKPFDPLRLGDQVADAAGWQ